jgi:ATP-binding cassette subfamily B protein
MGEQPGRIFVSRSLERGGSWLRRVGSYLPLCAMLRHIRRRRVPVVLQLTTAECGAACLAMVLNYYGRKTQLAECREFCRPGRDGLTALTIAQAARHFGLRVKAFSAELESFRHVPLPAIAHWNFSHFVVVERCSPTRIDIVDPSAGRSRLTA